MVARGPIAEQWFARTAESYPGVTAQFLTAEKDPFRNPVGRTLRQNLAALVDELFGDMNAERLVTALDAIVRIRAVQDFTAAQAVGFVFLLKPIVSQSAGVEDVALLNHRIDQLALLAFDRYMQCRERLGEIRVNEAKRAIRKAAGL